MISAAKSGRISALSIRGGEALPVSKYIDTKPLSGERRVFFSCPIAPSPLPSPLTPTKFSPILGTQLAISVLANLYSKHAGYVLSTLPTLAHLGLTTSLEVGGCGRQNPKVVPGILGPEALMYTHLLLSFPSNAHPGAPIRAADLGIGRWTSSHEPFKSRVFSSWLKLRKSKIQSRIRIC